MSTFGRLAATLADNGYSPIPIMPGQKRPAVSNWPKPASASRLARWCQDYPDHGVGILCGQVIGIDIDVLDPELAGRIEALAVAVLGPTPLIRIGQAPKRLMVYRAAEPIPTTSAKLDFGGLDILAAGRQFVAWGIHPGTGRPYEWVADGTPIDTPKDALPSIRPRQSKDFMAQALSLLSMEHAGASEGSSLLEFGQASAPALGLVMDGRDEHLRRLVYAAWRDLPDGLPEQIAEAAWARFIATTDLRRPAHDGRRPWTFADAVQKARYLTNKARRNTTKRVARARLKPHGPAPEMTADDVLSFRAATERLRDDRRLTASEFQVSTFMLDRLASGQCTDSVAFIACRTGLGASTVKLARKKLLKMGLWATARKLGKRDQTAPYRPVPRNRSQAADSASLSTGVVYEIRPNTIGISGVIRGLAPPSPSPIILPAQPSDTRQGILFPPLVGTEALRLILDEWSSGQMPEAVRVAVNQAKRRRNLRQEEVAAAIGLSRTQLANALAARRRREKNQPNAFDLSPEAIARLKLWLLSDAGMADPIEADGIARPARPHHRRGGKRPTDPGPALPMLRLFSVVPPIPKSVISNNVFDLSPALALAA